jgi:hypothetical protein
LKELKKAMAEKTRGFFTAMRARNLHTTFTRALLTPRLLQPFNLMHFETCTQQLLLGSVMPTIAMANTRSELATRVAHLSLRLHISTTTF